MSLEQIIAEETAKAKRYKAQANFGWDSITHKRLSPMECERNKYYAERHNQIATLLKELKERRKAPEIVRCKDCRHKSFCSSQIDCGNGLYYTIDFCSNGNSRVERRTDDNSRVDLS